MEQKPRARYAVAAARAPVSPALERASARRSGRRTAGAGGWGGTGTRVRLRGDEERVGVGWQLDELHQPTVWRQAGEDQAGLLEPLPVGVVDLVAVPVPLLHLAASP